LALSGSGENTEMAERKRPEASARTGMEPPLDLRRAPGHGGVDAEQRRIGAVGNGPSLTAFATTPDLTSARSQWDGILCEQYRLSGYTNAGKTYLNHHLCTHMAGPTPAYWYENGRKHNAFLKPGGAHLASAGSATPAGGCEQTFELFVVELSPGIFTRVLQEDAPPTVELRNQTSVRDAQIFSLAAALQMEISAGCPSGRLYAELLGASLTAYLARHYCVWPAKEREVKGGMPAHRLRQTIEYIEANLTGDLRLEEMAENVQMSPYTFGRLFTKTTGLTPHQYVLRARIKEAKRLLCEGKSAIADVSLQLGFSDQSHFTRVFHKITGITPRKFLLGYWPQVLDALDEPRTPSTRNQWLTKTST
jgi:AraC family transcriptional regulator